MNNLNENNYYNSNNYGKDNNNKFLGKKVKSSNFRTDKNNNKNKYHNEAKNDNNNKEDYYYHKDNMNNNYRNNSKSNYVINDNNNNMESHNANDSKLPIFNKREEILEKIQKNRVIIISGNTGCGKSTQVPQFIYEYSKDSKILMTQPRRIAAISIAKRLSDERHTKLGSLIGYHVSLLQYMTSETKIFVKTTGIFLEELLHNNGLNYSYIILDEVHERDLYIDLVLALLKNCFINNPDSKIKLILMSATIAEEDFANYLKDVNKDFNKEVPIIRINEKWHEVQNFYVDDIILKILSSNKVSQNLKRSINNEKSNCVSLDYFQPTYSDSLFPVVAGIIEKTENVYTSKRGILIFVPGLGEIQDLYEYLTNYFGDNNDLEFFILHSQVNDDEQERVFKINEKKRKIILATNIAESSITISNIDFVIDFCLVKQMKFDENQNTSILELKWCSKASCQQRRGRTGRVAKGYYFQLITKELFKQFKDHQEPEILRTPLETPILKLKLFNPNEEPEKILFKTMNPPSQDVIINTIFRLQKMGALVNIKFEDNKEDNEEKFGHFGEMEKESKNNTIYNSGKVTKIGRIFADLPIDIKYSRLILLSYSLGQIEVGISLAAILSQDRTLFLNSNKCNRISLYDSKNHFCGNQNCDFIALYIAYKFWCSKFKSDFIDDSVCFDTRLKKVNRMRYKEILSFTKENNLDLRTIKEILKVENDLKKRLALKGFYSKYFAEKPFNFIDKKSAFILKIILAGTFYNQIFAPEYDQFQGVENDQISNNNKKQEELYTIRLSNIPLDEKDKLIEIFGAIVGQGKIEKVSYENCVDMLSIKFKDTESISKILFITSSCLRHNNEIPLFKYVNQKADSNDNNSNSINNNYNDDKTVIIRLGKEPDYLYNLHYFDVFVGGQIYMDKDSINLTHIIPNYEELKKSSFVTDSYINKSGNTIKKSARYTSLLPRSKMFDKLIMLIFGPKFEMIASKIENSDKFSQYIGFQYDEYVGNHCFDYESDNRNCPQKLNFKNNFIKLDYLITNYHLLTINEIRKMINEMIEPKFNIENVENGKKEFEEKMKLYLKNADDILKKIKQLVDAPKIKYISEKKYIELYNYIDRFKRKFKKHNYTPDPYEENKEDECERVENKVEQKNEGIFKGYINEIKKLNIKEEDFLQLHEPLPIMEEYYHSPEKRKKLLNKENNLLKIYEDYNDVLNTIKSLAFNNEAWLCCCCCLSEICAIKQGSPKMTEKKNIGEHIIEGAWITSSLKSVTENKDKIKGEQIEKFKEKLNQNNINYSDLFCCPKGETVIGYITKDERYIYYGSKLFVKYPDLNVECVFEEDYKNDFIQIHKKVEKILMEKEKKDFKKMICCKLCDFTVERNIRQFNQHILKKCHRERMEELKKEFLY